MGVANPKYPHLPPHHEPGEQSKTSRLTGGIGIVLCAGGGVFFCAMGAYLYTLRNSDAWRGKSIWGVEVFLAACGLIMFGLAYWIRLRRQGPREARHFSLVVDRQDLRRGESLTVTLKVHDTDELTGQLQVGLVAVERYDQEVPTYSSNGMQSTQRQTIENPIYEQWIPVDLASGSPTLQINVPADSYCSYEGECFSLAWRVAAREVRSQRRDPHSHVPVWVTP